MKILVFGIGVLGSYLTHELLKAGHEVTAFARGQRYTDLQNNGLVIQHVKQKRKTIDKISVINHLDEHDEYDIIFVVLQKSQLFEALPLLAKITSKRIAFIGNNGKIEETLTDFRRMSTANPKLLFGFISCAGRRDGITIHNWHTNKGRMVIAPFEKDSQTEAFITKLLDGTDIQPILKNDISAWLKHHSAMITPLALAIQCESTAGRNLRKSQALLIAVNATIEAIQMFERQDIRNEPPHSKRLMNWPAKRWRWILARLLATKTGKIMAIDHSRAAIGEIDLLAQELLDYSKRYQYPLPSLEKLYRMAKEKNARNLKS
ncbi:ketopantoate reductase family protein [Clostridium merdae]|uniref:ketopantoate reductase family protein n=1 Tax=Clostridium merdae TaxID=1958780 RepID=UPI0013563936|nr:2-dehydropantoate 2-reductase N-terminal domain-containing protein [Clostridium merdae]